MSLSAAKQYTFGFVSDGVATALVLDLSATPQNLDFMGKLPSGARNVTITNSQGVTVPSFSVGAVTGSSVTVTFSSSPPENDVSGNAVLYELAFLLTY
jgi:hypothetical protein